MQIILWNTTWTLQAKLLSLILSSYWLAQYDLKEKPTIGLASPIPNISDTVPNNFLHRIDGSP